MKTMLGLLAILAVGLATSPGTSWAAQMPAGQQAVQALTTDLPQAKVYMSGPRVTRVYGQPLSFGATPEESAERFRLGHAAVFGVTADQLEPRGTGSDGALVQPVMFDPETGDYKFMLARYVQQTGDVPVFRSDLRLLMRNEADFPLVLAASSVRSLGDFATPAGPVDFDPAALVTTGMERFTAPATVIWAGLGDTIEKPVLAVTFVGERGSPEAGDYEKWLYVADAATGDILYQEDRIIIADVVGNVSGMASEGPKADFCSAEVATPMSWATASIQGGSSAYADANGDFVIPNGGTSAVTVESPMNGHYFIVTDTAGPEEVLTQSVVPPGPADFMHNADNSSEFIRAQVNAYVQANIVRDFVLTYNPSYPTIAGQTDFPVRVNRTDLYCPGNAWYDYSSINFCRAGGGYPNTAWSNVVHHEYGHHTVDSGGSGQGQYGEGMSDSLAMLIADNPIMGYGFFGDCNSGLRTADNTYQYPCTGAIHDCGQLLSGCIWSTRNELIVTEPADYLSILSNLTVNSILLHSGTEITPQITIDFLTLDDDDGNIGNGTPHWTEICTGFGAHNMDCPELETGLSVSPTAGFDPEGPAGGPFTPDSKVYTLDNLGDYAIDYLVTKSASWLSLSNATGTLAPYGSTTVTVSLNAEAYALPNGKYTDTVNFTNTTDHVGDTTREVNLAVGVPMVVYEWTLDSDPGWSTEGLWAWGQPTGGGGQYGGPDPTGGYTGSNVYGYNLNGDYENSLPERHLTSTAIDCTGLLDVTLKFQRWLGVEQPVYDHAYVRVSNNGSNWMTVWENTVEVTDSSWSLQEFDISSVADGQPTVYLRWTMGPTDGAWQYCGWNIDDIQIEAINEEVCTQPSDCDDGLWCNGAEDCVAGSCLPGTDPCPGQYCDEGSDICVDCLNDGHCDDGAFCNGAETCVSGTCQPGTPIDCDDSVGCTVDSCNEGTDSCDNVPDDAVCDDGLYCTGMETCNVTAGCQPGGGVDCDDGVGCTADSCNEGTDSCDHVPDDAACDDGFFCTGVETCEPLADCQPGSDPCPGEDCDEVNDVCVPSVCDDDGTCEVGEDCNNCSGDCFSGGGAVCGNGVCEIGNGEDCITCPEDCNGTQTGKLSLRYCCGDGEGQNPVRCDDARCSSGGSMCTEVPAEPSCCGDEVCEGSEDGFNCEVDCGGPPFCGDASCDPGEDPCNCPDDCGPPPATETVCTDGIDEDCDGAADCDDPTGDCDADPACAPCLPRGEACTADAECCSFRCHRGYCK